MTREMLSPDVGILVEPAGRLGVEWEVGNPAAWDKYGWMIGSTGTNGQDGSGVVVFG